MEHKMARHRVEFYVWNDGKLKKTTITVANEREAHNIASGQPETTKIKLFNELEELVFSIGFEEGFEAGLYA